MDINKAGDGGSQGAGPMMVTVVVLEVEALPLDKEGVLRRTVVVVEVLLRVVVVVEKQVLGVFVAEQPGT